MIAALRDASVPVSMGGRGMIFNASVADLIRMISLVKVYAEKGACNSGFSRNDSVQPEESTPTIPAEAGTASSTVPPTHCAGAPECPA